MCTSIGIVTQDGYHLLERTMDWDTLRVGPLFLPRGYQWQTVFDHRTYQNRYALVGGGLANAKLVDVSDGVNEKGLMVQKLTFDHGGQLTEARHADKVQLAARELALYLLGRFASIAEIEAHLSEIELMSDTNSDVKYGHAEQHYAVMDATGRMVVIEPSQAPLRLRENPLGVLTNHPNFDSQIRRLHDYVTFSPAFEQGTVPLNTYHVTTGELSGKKTPPGAYSPSARFMRAAYMKELADQPVDLTMGVATTSHLLDTVTVPQSKRHRPTFSVYRSIAVAETCTYYFQAYAQLGMTALTLTPELAAQPTPQLYRND